MLGGGLPVEKGGLPGWTVCCLDCSVSRAAGNGSRVAHGESGGPTGAGSRGTHDSPTTNLSTRPSPPCTRCSRTCPSVRPSTFRQSAPLRSSSCPTARRRWWVLARSPRRCSCCPTRAASTRSVSTAARAGRASSSAATDSWRTRRSDRAPIEPAAGAGRPSQGSPPGASSRAPRAGRRRARGRLCPPGRPVLPEP